MATGETERLTKLHFGANIHDSVLTTTDPYHVPGYGGFCPQIRYRIGETFGRTTSRLLSDENVASSGRLVLAKKDPADKALTSARNEQLETVRNRRQSWGDQKLTETMVPGYTGFVPKVQHQFGKRYKENCVSAISEFEGDRKSRNERIAELRLSVTLANGKMEKKNFRDLNLPDVTNRYTTPMEPVSQSMKHYVSRMAPKHMGSPYKMQNTNPDKHFMSGYTGFVPRARNLLGATYPVITHLALNEFTDTERRTKALSAEPVNVHRQETKALNTKPIYPNNSGLVPHYTGHIPGEQFNCGYTFERSTRGCAQRIPSRQLQQPQLQQLQLFDAAEPLYAE